MSGHISKEHIQEIAAKQEANETAAKSTAVDGGQNGIKNAEEVEAAALIQVRVLLWIQELGTA